ncbi:YTH domain-containing protein ECT4-like isoform X2 [Magnolia sinica]|uniref:YTH domain-containing protein ECT4-like isoform X2 n=1 Tax=Magnolia sinica TaxID=86752 RepID=UPI002658678B|nr:YTH domain-containing protein ECT4-like isoform X2 [Magnolia sinica]
MEAIQQQVADRIVSADSNEELNILTLDNEEKPADVEKFKEQLLSAKDERMVSPNGSHNATATGPSRDTTGRLGSLSVGRDHNTVYAPNAYAPQAQTVYYGGYENATSDWEEYPHYINAEGMEIGSPGMYENPSLLFHTGYGYSPQMPYGPYSPLTPPLPSAELSMPAGIDQHGTFLSDSPNSSGVLFGPRPGYYGSFGKGSFAGSSGNPAVYELWQGFDGFGSGGPWSDWSKSSEGQRSLTPLPSPVASPQPIGTVGSFGHNGAPLASGMASLQQRPLHGFGSATSYSNRGFSHEGVYHQGMNFGGSISGIGLNDRSWIAMDKGGRRGRGSGSLCSCNGTMDILSEQNKGPRASRTKNSTLEHNWSVDGKWGASPKADKESYNRPDFVTEYKDAKFFIIKSYSEDNVHKSIKYSVWASTSGGNRRLDAAYRESKVKEGACPVFLLFSVNASAQFCGVAEMVGPVDFDKSVDYWQQDKWTGQFPVKWHVIKDVPNSQFRHITLENNENKPVTNSRDTQEVGLEQGLEMLNIFKNYEADMSILDDFGFYEDRQKAMQERKARQQAQQADLMPITASTGNGHRNPVPVSGDLIKQMSKSFTQAVRLEDSSKVDPAIEKAGSTAARTPTGAKAEDLANTGADAPLQGS